MNNLIFQSPKAVKAEMSRHVFGQDSLLEDLASLFFVFCSRVNCAAIGANFPVPESMLISGKTGTGKSHAVRTLAKLSGIPLISIDCNTLSLPGYKGTDLNAQILQQLQAHKIDNNSVAIVLLDELDKIVTNQGAGVGEYANAVQATMLSFLDGTFNVRADSDIKGSSNYFGTMNNIMIIATGTFSKHFKTCAPSEDVRADVVNSGIIPELAHRFTCMTRTMPLDIDELFDSILDSPDSAMSFYKNLFNYCGRELVFSEMDLGELKMRLKGGNIRDIRSAMFEVVKPKLMQISQQSFSADKFDNLNRTLRRTRREYKRPD